MLFKWNNWSRWNFRKWSSSETGAFGIPAKACRIRKIVATEIPEDGFQPEKIGATEFPTRFYKQRNMERLEVSTRLVQTKKRSHWNSRKDCPSKRTDPLQIPQRCCKLQNGATGNSEHAFLKMERWHSRNSFFNKKAGRQQAHPARVSTSSAKK